MKALVAYMSLTGNTKKVAEAIYSEIDCEKEIKPIGEVNDIGGWDLAFLGFPTHGYGPDKKTKEIMGNLCKNGRKVALFVTHAAPEDEPEVQEVMARFKQAAAGAELVGCFDCQGQLAKGVKLFMRLAPNKKLRSQAKKDNSFGQPDQTRLENARVFARNTMNQLPSSQKNL